MNSEKLKRLPHIFSGVIILLHSLERFEADHSSYLIFLFAGIMFLALAVFHHKISHKFPNIDVAFYAIESLLSFVIVYEYYAMGKNGLPFAYFIAGLFQLFAIFMFYFKAKKYQSGS